MVWRREEEEEEAAGVKITIGRIVACKDSLCLVAPVDISLNLFFVHVFWREIGEYPPRSAYGGRPPPRLQVGLAVA